MCLHHNCMMWGDISTYIEYFHNSPKSDNETLREGESCDCGKQSQKASR